MIQFILGAIGVVALSELSKKRSMPKMADGGIIRNEENKRLYDEIVSLAESIDVDYAYRKNRYNDYYENTRDYSTAMDDLIISLYELDSDDYNFDVVYNNIGRAQDFLNYDVIWLVENELGKYASEEDSEDFFTDTDYAKKTKKTLFEINDKVKILEKKVKGEMAIGGLVPTAPNGEYAKGGKVKTIKESDIQVGKKFELINGDVIEIKRLFKENIDQDWVEFTLNGVTKENSVNSLKNFINNWRAEKKYAKGGKVERVYIDFLNKKKNFQRDRKYFNSYEDAKKWALKNFDKFNSDMIKYE